MTNFVEDGKDFEEDLMEARTVTTFYLQWRWVQVECLLRLSQIVRESMGLRIRG